MLPNASLGWRWGEGKPWARPVASLGCRKVLPYPQSQCTCSLAAAHLSPDRGPTSDVNTFKIMN